jgi:hypothetical protein
LTRDAWTTPARGWLAGSSGSLILTVGLWVAIEALDLQGPDPEVPRHVLNGPAEPEPGPQGCTSFC